MTKFTSTVIEHSVKATAVVGINAGYGHANEAGVDLVKFGELVKSIADKTMDSTGIYVGGVVNPVKVLYKTDWGCPEGGEDSIRLEADCNPTYDSRPADEYVAAWKEAFIANIQALMEELDQTTVTVAYSDGEVVYIQRQND
jgi:hypothetical protein